MDGSLHCVCAVQRRLLDLPSSMLCVKVRREAFVVRTAHKAVCKSALVTRRVLLV